MKYILTIITAIILCSCSKDSIVVENPEKDTTIADLNKIAQDTSCYKVLVTDEETILVYQDNLLVYKSYNLTSVKDSLILFLFMFSAIIFTGAIALLGDIL